MVASTHSTGSRAAEGDGGQDRPFASAWRRAHLTVESVRPGAGPPAPSAAGRATAGGQPAADRPDPVALLEEQAASRVPELVPSGTAG